MVEDDNEQDIIVNNDVLPYLYIKINGIEVKSLIDFGSEISLISEKFISDHYNTFKGNIIKICKVNIYTATDKVIARIDKCLCTTFQVENHSFDIKFYILSGLSYDVIFGSDFLRRVQAEISYKHDTITFNEVVFKINSYINVKCSTKELLLNNYNANQVISLPEKSSMKDNIEIDCDPEYKELVLKMLLENEILFNDTPTFVRNYAHKISVIKDATFCSKVYPIPEKYALEVNKCVEDMLKKDVIESSTTSYINPVCVVVKSNSRLRICLDCRSLNKIVKKQYTQQESLDALLSKFSESTVFTALDLRSAFWLVRIEKSSRQYFGFRIDGNTYQFKSIPFGYVSSSSVLIKVMRQLFDRYSFVVHYVDDILVFSKDFPTHIKHLRIVLDVLVNNGFKLSLEKCNFFKTTVTYLGYVISPQGISVDVERIRCIKEYPRPTNVKKLKRFLGLLVYYKKFIPNLSNKCYQLFNLLKKNVPFKWNDNYENVFLEVKKAFCEQLMLIHPDFSKLFVLRCDSSFFCIGGYLLQYQQNVEKPICFLSKTLNQTQQLYSTVEKEALALTYLLQKFRYFLLGRKFVVQSDCSGLLTLMNNRVRENSRIYKWSLLWQEFDFEIQHISGRDNFVADSLSRLHSKKQIIGYTINLHSLTQANDEVYSKQVLIKVQQDNEEIFSVIDKLKQLGSYKRYYFIDNLLIKRIGVTDCIVVSKDHCLNILQDLHIRFSHIGIRKLFLLYRECFYTKNDYKLTKSLVNKCHICSVAKHKNYVPYNDFKFIETEGILKLISIDFLVNVIPKIDGYQHILIIVDNFSKLCKFYPAKKTNSKVVINCLRTFISTFNSIKIDRVILDNATYFTSNKFKAYLKKVNIKPAFIPIRYPSVNYSERVISEMLKFLRILCNENHQQWLCLLPVVEDIINNIPNTFTKISPVEFFGIKPIRPWHSLFAQGHIQADVDELVERTKTIMHAVHLQKINKLRKLYFKKKVQYNIGDLVLVKELRLSNVAKNVNKKLIFPYCGPFRINSVLGNNTYLLTTVDGGYTKGIFNINVLYPYRCFSM